jgi:4-amino-4-deoxy-L-arabinose transferase-like glycosyltransferase
VALLIGAAVFATGSLTDLSLGDENYHFRKAAHFAEAGRRLTHDPDYGPTVPPGIPYYDGPLWHGLLALLWRLTGPSALVAQAYQAVWVVLFVGLAWTAGRDLGGPATGWWTALMASSLPAALFFGIVLYVEVAMLALLTGCAVLLIRRRVLLGGIVFGAAFLVRPPVAVGYPAFLAGCLLLNAPSWPKRLPKAFLGSLGVALPLVPDLVWRQIHLGTVGVVYMSRSGGDPEIPESIRRMLLEKGPEAYHWAASVLDPADVLMHVGVLVSVGLVLSLVLIRRLGRPAKGLWLVAVAFLVPQAAFMAVNRFPDVRYVMPVFPVLVLLAGWAVSAALKRGRRPVLAGLAILVAVAQAGSVLTFVHERRQIPPETMAAMRRLGRLEVRRPPGFVLCPEPFVTTYSGRPILWVAVNPGAFFFRWSPEKQWTLLDYYGVEFIAVPQHRVYDDTETKHTGGMPRSYVERLSELPYVVDGPVIQGGGLSVYRVRPRSPVSGGASGSSG